MTVLALILVVAAAVLQFVAAVGAIVTCPVLVLPILLFLTAGACLLAGAIARPVGHPRASVALVATGAVLAVAAPLAWGHGVGEFTLSHHLVRAAVAVVVVGCHAWTTR